MKTFCTFAAVAACLSVSFPAWAGPASGRADAAANTPPTATSTATSNKAAHDYWLGKDIGRLALLLPSRKADEAARR